MPWNQTRSRNTSDREILAYPAGQDAIKSVVVAASGIPTLASAIYGEENVKGLLAGTALEKIPGDTQGRVRKFTNGTIVGVLGSNLTFAGEGDNFDAPAEALFHGCVFRKDRIVDWVSVESDIEADLPTCRFE